jgi:predicted DNA-binding protein YlxM (UPF0122 family)
MRDRDTRAIQKQVTKLSILSTQAFARGRLAKQQASAADKAALAAIRAGDRSLALVHARASIEAKKSSEQAVHEAYHIKRVADQFQSSTAKLALTVSFENANEELSEILRRCIEPEETIKAVDVLKQVGERTGGVMASGEEVAGVDVEAHLAELAKRQTLAMPALVPFSQDKLMERLKVL